MVSPTKRIPFAHLPQQFSPEMIELFVELERVKPSKRFADERTKRLAVLLGLESEFLMGQTVSKEVEAAAAPKPWLAAHEAWETCQRVRELILQAVERMRAAN